MGHQDVSFGVKRAKKKKKVVNVVGNIVINHTEIKELLKKKSIESPKMTNHVYQSRLVCKRTRLILTLCNFFT